MSDTKYTPINAMVDIVAAPGKALDEIKNHTAWLWWPLLISIVVASAAFAYYYSWVDMDWLTDERIRALPEEQRVEAGEAMRQMASPSMNIMVTIPAIAIMTLLIYLVQAAYLHLVTKLGTGAQIKFGQWFSFSAWTAFVGVFAAIIMFIVIFMADNNQVAEYELTPLSMTNLLLGAEPGDDWFNWGNSLSLINIWMLVLMTIGYNRWTGASMAKSAIIVSLPWVLIFGIWALMV